MPETQDRDSLPSILAKIVETKRAEISELSRDVPRLEAAAERAPATRDLIGALRAGPTVSLIAECKRRSPGAGDIRADLDTPLLARAYESAGAAALSVLTDATYFGGSLEDLRKARAATSLPVLRKDFTLDPIQVVEARASGADAVLLIVRILSDVRLRRLLADAEALGMTALVETHDATELGRAIEAGASLIGINNRDLATFTTDLHTTLGLLEQVPDGVVVVSESGIRNADDVARLGDVGVDAILVGEALLKADDPSAVARELARVPRGPRAHD